MPKRISRKNGDVNQIAKAGVEEHAPIDRDMLSRVMSEMGRKGGKIGGKRRLEKMTAEERSKVALRAAQARWSKRKKSRQQ